MASRPSPNGQCKICQFAERRRLELLVASGASVRSVAKKYGLPYHATWRHMKHVPEERKVNLRLGPVQQAALAARVSEESESVLDHYRIIRAGLYQHFDAALEAGDRSTGSMVAGKLIEVCNSIAKLTGQLAQSPLVLNQQNIFLSPAVAELEAMLIRTLAQYPEASAAVIRQIRDLEARAGSQPLLEHRDKAAA